MRNLLGRIFQVLGLTVVIIGLFVGVSVGNVKAELIYLGVGIALFYGGRYVERGTIETD